MKGWMDGRMDGKIDRWLDGWTDLRKGCVYTDVIHSVFTAKESFSSFV